MVGSISNIVPAKGFGFISGENSQEYFFHMSEVENWQELVDEFTRFGSKKVTVTFEPMKTPKGPRAKNVTLFKDKD